MDQNPKSEARNPKQIQNPNDPTGRGAVLDIWNLDFGFVSDFVLRISDFPSWESPHYNGNVQPEAG
jgi:hypothetical protein